jgi:hypothetical protein
MRGGIVHVYTHIYTTLYNFHERSWLSGVALRHVELFYCFAESECCTAISLGMSLQFYVATT